jgi:hypothetical protein
MRRLLVVTAATAVALVATNARGDTLLRATLNTFNEPVGGVLGTLNPTTTTGAPRPLANGTVDLVLNDAQTALTMTMTINGLDFGGLTAANPADDQTPDINDDLRNAHIHAGPGVTATTNGSVVWGFIGSPFNDNNPMDVVVTPFAAPAVGGTVTTKWDAPEGQGGTTLAAQLTHLLNRRAYVNFHTQQFSGGEIRGTIVPEPSSIVLASLAVVGALAVRHVRRRRAA